MKKQFTKIARIFGLKLTSILFLMLVSGEGWGQTTIFSENMGTPTGTTTIVNYSTGTTPATFQNIGTLTYSNGAQTYPADLRVTLVSSGYTGASGNGNVYFTSTSGAYGFSIESINGSSYTSISLQFGYRKESATLHATFSVDYWDGSTWSTIANTSATLFNEAAGAATGWYLSKSLSLPVGAQISGLKLRFVKTDTNSIRIDDVKLTGTQNIAAPTTQAYGVSFTNVTSVGMKIDWTNGNGAKRVVIINSTNSFTAPTDGTDPTANATYSGSGEQVVYNGSGNSFTVSGLTASTPYYLHVYEYNGSSTTTKFITTNATNNPNTQTTASASSPLITVIGSLSAFTSTVINTNSAEQSYTVEGSNLTANIIVTPPSGFEISTATGGGFVTTNPITLTHSGGTVGATTIYVRFAPTAVQAYSGNITNTSTGVVQVDVAISGTGIKGEPTNHATSFSVATTTPTYSSINISWVDATGGTVPDGYVIKASSVSYAAIVDPADGIPETAGSFVKIVAASIQTASFTGLSGNTPYYFKIYTYTNSGIDINYKTNGTIPQATATTDVQPILTYTWNVASGNWNTAASWTPDRTFPATSDILIFDGSAQASPVVTIDFTSPQSIGRLAIINNANVAFATSADIKTLNIGYTGVTAPQLEITSGATLTVSSANAVTINVLTGYNGSISGNILFQNAAHLLKAADASGITFNSGSSFTAGTGFTGSAFGTTSPYNTIVFASGSTYNHEAGSNPFGLSTPNSKVVFQTGSTYKQKVNVAPALNGRTYANFEIDVAAFSQSLTGTAGVTMDNLILTNSTSVGMNLTGAMNIKGNISINSGTLSFSPTSATNINLNGTSTQTISGAGTLTIGSNANFVVDNNVIADRNITFGGALSINSGKSLTINSNKQITVTGTLTNSAGTSGLVIKSDATGTASLIHSTVGVAATVERYIPVWSGSFGWHLLSSPVDNQSINANFTTTPPENYDFYKWDASTELWRNQKESANNITNFTNGVGYLVSYLAAGTHNFEGSMNVADVSPALSYYATSLGAWNLIGNPYPCSLNGNMTSWTKTNMETTVHVMDATDNTFKVWNSDNTGNLPLGQIPAMQGFWVASTTTGASLTIPATAKTHSNSNFYKTTLNDHLILNVESPNATKDAAFIYFKGNNSNGVDINDGSLMRSTNQLNTQIYSYINSNPYVINALGTYTAPIDVNIGFEPKMNGNFTITAGDVQSFNTTSHIWLQDLKTNTIQDLRINPIYSFNANTTDTVNRFKLLFDFASTGIHNANAVANNIYAFGNSIYFQSNENVNQISVYNMLGQEVANSKHPVSNILTIHQAGGYYIVKVITDKNVYSEKVLVK